MAVNWKPEGYSTVSPYFYVQGGEDFIKFLENVFDAEVKFKSMNPEGKIGHCEVRIGDVLLMMGEPPESSTMQMHVYVPDVDATFRKAVEAGATGEQEPTDRPHGDRMSTVKDRWGNTWFIATHVKDVELTATG